MVIFGVVTVIFVLSRLIGDPIALMIQPGMTVADIEELRAIWNLDAPIPEQFIRFLGSALTGDFGLSIWQGQPALGLVLESLPATLLLTSAALLGALLLALVLGSLAAIKRDSMLDRTLMSLTLFGQSVPNFWLALMLVLVVSVHFHLLPPAGYGTGSHLVLPAIALGLFPLARLTRLVRAELLDVLSQDYIRTARSKGIAPWLILVRHCLRNIAISLVTVIAVDFGTLMGGAVVTETIFAWPGMGRLMIDAISHRDFPIMQAGAFVVALVVVLTSLIADITYAIINPRIRYA
ncbi:ABC transporter permease subunit [Microvirga zambiensis]|uniref:ABC transporter permease subunit n=1 Tax=Microvirga zambiensis TaxID=1402137 RepID=UPI00191EF0EF